MANPWLPAFGSREVSSFHSECGTSLRRAGFGHGPVLVCLILILVAGAYLLSAYSYRPPSEETAPRVGFLPADLDLGQIPWKTKHRFSLVFRNRSSESIEIVEVKTSCDCAVIDANRLTSEAVVAGSSVRLDGDLDAGLRAGPVERSVTAVDSRGKSYSAILRANVQRTWEVVPPSLDFGRVAPEDGTVALELTVRPATVRLTAAPTSDVEWLSATTEGPRILVRADVGALPSGKHVGRINLVTDDAYVSTYSVPISVIRTSSITLIPSHAFLVDQRPVTIRVEDAEGRPVKIVDWRASVADVDVDTASPGRLIIRSRGDAREKNGTIELTDERGYRAILKISRVVRTNRKESA